MTMVRADDASASGLNRKQTVFFDAPLKGA
jgi:hypothetical protein